MQALKKIFQQNIEQNQKKWEFLILVGKFSNLKISKDDYNFWQDYME